MTNDVPETLDVPIVHSGLYFGFIVPLVNPIVSLEVESNLNSFSFEYIAEPT